MFDVTIAAPSGAVFVEGVRGRDLQVTSDTKSCRHCVTGAPQAGASKARASKARASKARASKARASKTSTGQTSAR